MSDRYQATARLTRLDGSVMAEAGDVTDEIPSRDVKWLVAAGHIVKVNEKDA